MERNAVSPLKSWPSPGTRRSRKPLCPHERPWLDCWNSVRVPIARHSLWP